MKFLIIADPIAGLKPKSDTGLSILREALRRGHEVYWATASDIRLNENILWLRASRVASCDAAALPKLDPQEEGMRIDEFDGLWIRKDPPFDSQYQWLCWLLSLEERRLSIMNPPSQLLRYHEKMLPLEALRAGYVKEEEIVPTYLVTGKDHDRQFPFPKGEVISKPWLGYGGQDVLLWPSITDALSEISTTDESFMLFQPFISTVKETGDRRVIFVDGEYAGDFVRMPQKGSIRANLMQGGIAELREMTEHEKDLTERVGKFLKSIGIYLAGADYIGEFLIEINITAPTGFESLAELGQPNPSRPYVDLAEQLVTNKA
jgi:glutathione synthase